jgi:hypothetical protein
MAKLTRAGIIPYIKRNGIVLFIFGLDEAIANISDFGGTRENRDKDIYETAIREFSEESFGVLGELDQSNVVKATYIQGDTGFRGEQGVLFFVPFKTDFPLVSKMQEMKERAMPGDETKALICLTKEQLFQALKGAEERIQSSKIFLFHPKVKSILLSGIETIECL